MVDRNFDADRFYKIFFQILLAKNKELNCWASLKKATQIRPEHVELNEVKTFKNKARNEYLKRKILPSLYGEGYVNSYISRNVCLLGDWTPVESLEFFFILSLQV